MKKREKIKLILFIIFIIFFVTNINAEIPTPDYPVGGYYFYNQNFHVSFEDKPGLTTDRLDLTLTNYDTGKTFVYNDFLYDDGKHNDGAAGDGNYGFDVKLNESFPLGEYNYMGYISYSSGLRGTSGGFIIIERVTGECEELKIGLNDPNDKSRSNLIFLHYKIGSVEGGVFNVNWSQFLHLVNSYTNFDQGRSTYILNGKPAYLEGEFSNTNYSLFNELPFKDYRNKFNVWYTTSEYPWVGDPVGFAYARCPLEGQIIVFHSTDISAPLGNFVGATFYPAMEGSRIFLHEFGHSFVGLVDEYSDTYLCSKDVRRDVPSTSPVGEPHGFNVYYASDQTNTQLGCETNSLWHYLVGSCYQNGKFYFVCPNTLNNVSCWHGGAYCYDKYYWRPAENTLMRYNRDFSSVDITAFCQVLEAGTGVKQGICNDICLDGCEKGYLCRDTDNDGAGECVLPGTGCTNCYRPNAPTGLNASLIERGVRLNWKDNSDNENEFVIERSSDEGNTWVEIKRVGYNITSYDDMEVHASPEIQENFIEKIIHFLEKIIEKI